MRIRAAMYDVAYQLYKFNSLNPSFLTCPVCNKHKEYSVKSLAKHIVECRKVKIYENLSKNLDNESLEEKIY